MYDEQSIDDARSMVESLHSGAEAGPRVTVDTEQDDIIGQTAALLANLTNQTSNVNEEEEEAKRQQVQARMADLGAMINNADQFRQGQ